MQDYIKLIWRARYFWIHLARAELKYKFRRSKIGIIWVFLNPLLLTLLMAAVLGGLFKMAVKDYVPYILSGIIVWELLISSVIGGCNSIIVSEPYIKQYKQPLAIYPLKTTIVNITNFIIALQGLFLWVLFWKPQNLKLVLILPFSILLIFLLCWPISLITSFTNTKYRDFSQFMTIVMQAIWYVSPIFYDSKMFKAKELVYIIQYNPVTHILNLVRAPILYGNLPSFVDFAFVIGLIIILFVISLLKIKREEKEMIFYL